MQETKKKDSLSWQGKLERRQWSNKKILGLMGDIVDSNPELRFFQILYILGYETTPDRFYEESYDTLDTMLKWFEERNKELKEEEK